MNDSLDRAVKAKCKTLPVAVQVNSGVINQHQLDRAVGMYKELYPEMPTKAVLDRILETPSVAKAYPLGKQVGELHPVVVPPRLNYSTSQIQGLQARVIKQDLGKEPAGLDEEVKELTKKLEEYRRFRETETRILVGQREFAEEQRDKAEDIQFLSRDPRKGGVSADELKRFNVFMTTAEFSKLGKAEQIKVIVERSYEGDISAFVDKLNDFREQSGTFQTPLKPPNYMPEGLRAGPSGAEEEPPSPPARMELGESEAIGSYRARSVEPEEP